MADLEREKFQLEIDYLKKEVENLKKIIELIEARNPQNK